MFDPRMNSGVLMSHFHNQPPPMQHPAGGMGVHPPSMHHAAGGAPHPGARMNNHMAAAADRMRGSAVGGTGMSAHMPTLPGIGGGAMLQAMAPRLPTTLSAMGGPAGMMGGLQMPRP